MGKKLVVIFGLFIVYSLLLASLSGRSGLIGSKVYAQSLPNLSSVAVNIAISDSDVSEGHIIAKVGEEYKKANKPADINIYGVVVSAPILSVKPKSDKTRAVVSSGEVLVKVNTKGGEIAVGDFITSSESAGVGQKAGDSGYVLGKALQEYKDSSRDGQILVSVAPQYFTNTIGARGPAGTIAKGVADAFGDPVKFSKFSRYFLGALVGIIAFAAAVFAFIRFISTGLEAMGRNPLAKRTIITGMIVSASVVIVLALAGAGAVLAIISFKG